MMISSIFVLAIAFVVPWANAQASFSGWRLGSPGASCKSVCDSVVGTDTCLSNAMTLLNSDASIREVAFYFGITCVVAIGTKTASHPSIGEGNVCYFPTEGSTCTSALPSPNQRICCCGTFDTCSRIFPSNAPSKTPSKAPSKSPSRSPSKAPTRPTKPCFSGENLVSVLGKGEIRLASLEIGDYVRSMQRNDAYYSRVYGFLHLHRQVPTEFLKFFFHNENSQKQLEVTPDHLLFSKGRAIAAGHVKVGDVLDGEDGKPLHVIGIETVQRDGVYAPATESGDIVVSGVRASNYVNLFNTSAIDQHTMSHAFMAPMRLMCKLHFDWCKQETYTEEGYSHWVKFFVWIAGILNRWGPSIPYITTLLISPIVVVLTALDLLSFQSLVTVGLSMAACIGVHGKCFSRKAVSAM